MRRCLAAALALATVVACSKRAPETTSSKLELRPFTISFRGQPIARLFPDGRTESAGPNAPGAPLVPGPTLHADGTISMTRGGVTARIDDHGDIHVGDELFGHIAGDHFTFAGSSRPWDVRVHGNMIEFGEDNSSVIDGEVTPAVQHTALVMAAAFYIEGALATK